MGFRSGVLVGAALRFWWDSNRITTFPELCGNMCSIQNGRTSELTWLLSENVRKGESGQLRSQNPLNPITDAFIWHPEGISRPNMGG